MAKGRDKRPPTPPSQPPAKRSPRNLPQLPGASNSGDRPCWRFEHADNEGRWGFGGLDGDSLRGVLAFLQKFETMTLNELFHNGGYPGKDYDVEALPTQEARDCLEEAGLADQTKIWALRCGGKPRLYGFLDGNVFHIVFWDPEHEIWPSQLRNT